MRYFHREGNVWTVSIAFILIALVLSAVYTMDTWLWISATAVFILAVIIFQFFRNPARPIPARDAKLIYAPADGKVVVIEEIIDSEYFGDRRIQLSIFMSPVNVHVNRVPVDGTVVYSKYHEGKYLVAWNPKSSTENERHSTVIASAGGEILLKQIAGALAKRIRNYAPVGKTVHQGEELGFIKFGSRVDILLPLDAEVLVSLDQKVLGNRTPVARLR